MHAIRTSVTLLKSENRDNSNTILPPCINNSKCYTVQHEHSEIFKVVVPSMHDMKITVTLLWSEVTVQPKCLPFSLH